MREGLPKGWYGISIGDVVGIHNGFAFKTKDFRKSGIPLVKQTNLVGDTVSLDDCQYLDANFLQEKENFILNQGDILIGMSGSLGKVSVYRHDFPALQNQRTGKLKFYSLKNLSKNLFLYYFTNIAYILEKSGKGCGVQNISGGEIEALPFPLPPLKEQKRIVAKLDAIMPRIDAVEERLDKVPGILKRFRQSVLTSAVTGKLTEQWREEHPEAESAEMLLERIRKQRETKYKQECEVAKKHKERKPKKLSKYTIYRDTFLNIPDNWIATSPEEIAAPQQYSLAIGPFGSNLKVSDYTNVGVPIVFVKNIRSGDFLTNRKYVSISKAKELFQHTVRPGDLLITKMGDPPGDCCVYGNDLENGIITSDCLKFSTWDKYVETRLYNFILNSFIIKSQFIELTQGVAQQKISLERFKSIHLPLPPLEEQKEIVRQVDKLFTLADQVEAHYKNAKAQVDKLSQSVLAKAFRGDLVPQDPNDEPAEKLLERILDEKTKMEAELKGTRKKGIKKAFKKNRSKS